MDLFKLRAAFGFMNIYAAKNLDVGRFIFNSSGQNGNTEPTRPFQYNSRSMNLSKSDGWFNEASLLIAFITVFTTLK